MSTILLVKDVLDLGLVESKRLEAEGHHILRCWGGPTPFAACPMMREGWCALPHAADLIVFSCDMSTPVPHRTYRGVHLLRAYREHPAYGRLPMLVGALGVPDDIGGSGPIQTIETPATPETIVQGVRRLLAGGASDVLTSIAPRKTIGPVGTIGPIRRGQVAPVRRLSAI